MPTTWPLTVQASGAIASTRPVNSTRASIPEPALPNSNSTPGGRSAGRVPAQGVVKRAPSSITGRGHRTRFFELVIVVLQAKRTGYIPIVGFSGLEVTVSGIGGPGY